MNRIFSRMFSLALVATMAMPIAQAQDSLADKLKGLELPEGFSISLVAENVTNARQLAIGDKGTIFVGTRNAGVYALVDTNGDHKTDKMHTLVKKFQVLSNDKKVIMPMGVAFKGGSLYIVDSNHVLRLDDIESKLANPGAPVVVVDDLPRGLNTSWANAPGRKKEDKDSHYWHYVGFGPDGKLYIPLGSPYDVGEEIPELMQIMRMNADGSGRETVVRGVRNVMGLDWNPKNSDLWFTDNGVDHLGTTLPHEELNRVAKEGTHYGHPFVHQGDIVDPVYGKGKNAKDFVAPAQKLNPHCAPMGMTFYSGKMFPKKYRNAILVAERNGETVNGKKDSRQAHRVALVLHNEKKGTSYEPFLTGFMEGDAVWGKPFDIINLKDGSILISDDTANAIYRVTYSAK